MLLILLSSTLAVLCYLAFTAWLPSNREQLQDYRAAEPCPAQATAQVQEDCLSTGQITVVKTEETGTRSKTYKATLKNEGSWRGYVLFNDQGPLFERLEPGDQVTATLWRRHIVVLDKDGVEQNTTDVPRDELQMNAALGTLAALLAAQMLVFGAVRLVRPRSYEPFTFYPYGGRILFTILGAGFGVGFLAGLTGIPWWFVPPAIPVVCAAVMLYPPMRRRPTVLSPEDRPKAV
ncbi:hypothetical protein ACIOC2_06375 [Streptomyces sp. NPDC088337]|uniref:hypothetical protein n=1 Tax=unclassified Streptomyces TaxID=2593676 RepID=UPI002DD8A849|nr:hypothetical protein [Streptomyces sp. NBC_01788]WSB26459.1 hypothetical protein OIE49_11415 [Streptomyces sp. NBC_01788]